MWRSGGHRPARLVMSSSSRSINRPSSASLTSHMDDLGITIAGVPFPHLLYHFVLAYSNVEAVHLCFSESFEALAEGLESASGSWEVSHSSIAPIT
jgi:hypothetical protein